MKITNYKLQITNYQSGIAVLMAVVIISSAILLMAYTASLLGLGEIDMSWTAQKGKEAFSVADGCMEETLRRIRINTGYGVGEGDINLTVSNGSCIINVDDLGSNQRRITVAGTSGSYHKKIRSQITITLDGKIITVNSWEELTT